MADRRPARSRLVQAVAAAAVITLGLISRSGHIGLSRFWAKYSGDALWAIMVFLLVGLLFPRRSSVLIGSIALAYSCVTEFSQLYHAPWIDSLRHNPLGHLVLGDTFSWGDMAAYLSGIIVTGTVETAANHFMRPMPGRR